MAATTDLDGFPTWALLPKKETEVSSFLNKNPEYDGRGVIIAIFDSGVDPGAEGLQVTTDGKPKLIDRIDASGVGDVDTATIVSPKDGYITGLTGRKLKIPEGWCNPSGQYRVGIKNPYDIYCRGLKNRIVVERAERHWDPVHKECVADAVAKLQDFDSKNKNPTGEDKLTKENLEHTVDMLASLEKDFNDLGPTYDCVLFHDGTTWRACIDTSEKGELEGCRVYRPYRETLDYGPLTPSDSFNISINVYEDGDLLEIVGMCSSHGTHVAAITAANFPDAPEKNGVAPGAQLVSITIGDNRLGGSMETSASMVRAIIRAMNKTPYKIDIINQSFGEHPHWVNSGRLQELTKELVEKYGVIFVSSAGNNGPGLTTVGTPADFTDVISVGAYLSSPLSEAAYSMQQKVAPMSYTFSSRGPSADGGRGVTVCAPGGAITSVPNYTLKGCQLMHGTSMSSPQVAGGLGLLLSGLKTNNIPYSPFSIRRSIENTASFDSDDDYHYQGHGLIQIEKAYQWLVTYQDAKERDVKLSVNCWNGSSRGIYFRGNFRRPSRMHDVLVAVEPVFLNQFEVDNQRKIEFNMKLRLFCDATWVTTPMYLNLMYSLRTFTVRVDGRNLTPGIHVASVKAYDSECPKKGFLFEVPINVVIPEEKRADHMYRYKTIFKPGSIDRHFYTVPEGATWAVINMKSLDPDRSSRYMVHCLQIKPHTSISVHEFTKLVTLGSYADTTNVVPVKDGLVEVCIARWWASHGNVELQYSIAFSGLLPDRPEFTVHGGEGVLKVDVKSFLKHEEMAVNVSLKNQLQYVRPSESKVLPLGKRDVIPIGRAIYQLLLTYSFHIAKAVDVSPRCSMLADYLYENEFIGQMWLLFDSNKQLLASGDAYPGKYGCKLEKGDYTLKLEVRHERKELLDKMTDLMITLVLKLPTNISLDAYSSWKAAVTGGKKIPILMLTPGVVCPVYISPTLPEKYLKGTSPGQSLTGTISFSRDELGKKADTYPLRYIVSEQPKKSKNDKDKEKTKAEEYAEAIRDLKVNWLPKLDLAKEGNELWEELKSGEWSKHLPVLLSRLQSLDSEKGQRCRDVVAFADEILQEIDQVQILAQLATKTDTRSDAIKLKQATDKGKAVLLETLCRKGTAMCNIMENQNEEQPSSTSQPSITLTDINNVYNQIVKFVDPSDSKVISFCVLHALANKHYGRAAKLIYKQMEEGNSTETEQRFIEVCGKLGWSHVVFFREGSFHIRFPPSYQSF